MEAGSSDATFDLADYRTVKLTPSKKVGFWACDMKRNEMEIEWQTLERRDNKMTNPKWSVGCAYLKWNYNPNMKPVWQRYIKVGYLVLLYCHILYTIKKA